MSWTAFSQRNDDSAPDVDHALNHLYGAAEASSRVYEVGPCAGGNGFELTSDALPQGRLTFEKERVATGYARLHSGSHLFLIRIFDAHGNLIATHDHSAAAAALPR